MIIQSLMRIIRILLKYVLNKCRYWRRGSSLTQSQMNQALIGPEFDLALRYGELLNLIFVTMFFGSGK